MRKPSLLATVALASLALSFQAHAGPAGALPAGLPSHLSVGLAEGHGSSWMRQSGVPWDVRYQYLTIGWSNNWGWGAHDGSYALAYMQEAGAAKMIPSFTYYQINGEPGGGEDQTYAKTQNAGTMNEYFSDLKLLLQRAKDFGKPVIVHLEPDGFAFLERQTNGNPNAYAAIAASGVPELAGLPNTVAGWGLAFLQLRKAVGATNVIYGVHISSWASGADFASGSVTDPLNSYVDTVHAFLKPLGLGANTTGATFDLLVGDPLDRDADYYRLTQGANKWWDPGDTASINSQSFNRYAEWLRLWNQASGKRWMLWQIPLGNSNHSNVYNNGGSREGYKDNRAEYFFAGSTAHAQKFADGGVVALLFGAGASGMSWYDNDTYTDGQLFIKSRVGKFYAAGGLALGAGGGPTTPSFTSSATALPAVAAPGAVVTITASITDTGAPLANGVVDIEVLDATGKRVGRQSVAAQSFTANQASSYTYSWTAPAAAGTYSIAVGVFGPNHTPSYHWNATAGSVKVALPLADPAQYSFEPGTQSWLTTGGMLTGVASATSPVFAGSRSLAVAFKARSASSGNVFVRNPSTPAGKQVTFHLWIPAGNQINWVQPYVQQGAAGGWTWTGNWMSAASLTPGAWNTITVQVPAGAAPLVELGVQIATKKAWTGTAYLDSVGW